MALDRIKTSQAQAALEIWNQIQTSSLPADRWLKQYFQRYRKKFGARDRRTISDLVFTCFRHKRLIEEELKSLPADGFAEKMFEFLETDPSLSEKNLKLPSAVRYSVPDWLANRWQKQWPDQINPLLPSLNERASLVIRANPLKISRDELEKSLKKAGLEPEKTTRAALGLKFNSSVSLLEREEFKKGWFEIQDEGSQLLCEQIALKPGESIWDVCAGSGGKTLFLAAIAKNEARITASDIRPKILLNLVTRAKRAGVKGLEVVSVRTGGRIRPREASFDHILIDAPCTSTGTWRRRPDLKWKLSETDFKEFHGRQVLLIRESLPYLKKGGKLYYMTCSIDREENESVIEEVLKLHKELREKKNFRLWPHVDKTDGFFMSVLENF